MKLGIYKTDESVKANILIVPIPWIGDLELFTIVTKDGDGG